PPTTIMPLAFLLVAMKPYSSTSSVAKASTLPARSSSSDWPWSGVVAILMPSFCLSDSVRTAASLVVPAVTTTDFPVRSRYDRTGDDLGTMSLVQETKEIGRNATSLRRWTLLVVQQPSYAMTPHG